MSNLEFSELLGNYGEFVGAIAIVVTLVYLAIQLRQNTASVRANAYQSWVATNVDINVALSNPGQSLMALKGNLDPRELTEESAVSYLMIHLSEMNRIATLLRTPGVRQMWDAGAKSQLSPKFVETLESIESTATYAHWDSQRGFYSLDELGS